MRTSKNRKIFSANNEQRTIKRGEKWFPEKLWKKIDLENFRSESFSKRTYEGRAPASELVLQRGSLPSEIALQGGSLESKMVYRGVGADFEKPKKWDLTNVALTKPAEESLDILPGDWVCRGCTANNFAKRQTCFKCGSKRRVSSFTNCTVILYTIYSVTITVQFWNLCNTCDLQWN